jgi:hypothetical protein
VRPPPVLVTLAALALARAASAQGAAPPADADARYAFILDSFERERPSMELWWSGFTIGYVGLAGGQAGAALFWPDDGMRKDAAVGAVESSLGIVGMLITPRTAIDAPYELGAMDASSPAARERRLRRAEHLLEKSAHEEALGQSWVPHLAAAVVNLTGTGVLWIGYHRYTGGWLNLLGGTAISQVQILTRPTASIEAWRRYRAGDLAPEHAGVRWSIAPTVGGLELVASF